MPDPSAWRVDNAKWAAQSFNGYGASIEGGRWNSAGSPVVYASEHLAMAAQEKYVHLTKPLPKFTQYVRFAISFGDIPITRLSLSDLPEDWQAEPVPVSTQDVGDEWILRNETAILAVPSVLIPEETNYVLNPGHPDFAKIRISKPEPFFFAPRLSRLVDPPAPV